MKYYCVRTPFQIRSINQDILDSLSLRFKKKVNLHTIHDDICIDNTNKWKRIILLNIANKAFERSYLI